MKPKGKSTKNKKDAKADESKQKLHWYHAEFAWVVSTQSLASPDLDHTIKAVERLARRILKNGGNRVVVQFGDPQMFTDALGEHGEVYDTEGLQLQPSAYHNVHKSCADLWKQNKVNRSIATGYGLDDDQVWRRHSWLTDEAGNIIETANKKLIYFGVGHAPGAAEKFCEFFGGENSQSACAHCNALPLSQLNK